MNLARRSRQGVHLESNSTLMIERQKPTMYSRMYNRVIHRTNQHLHKRLVDVIEYSSLLTSFMSTTLVTNGIPQATSNSSLCNLRDFKSAGTGLCISTPR